MAVVHDPRHAAKIRVLMRRGWVIPGNGFICLDVGSMACNAIEKAAAQGW